jgi:hypothetical protein
VINDAINKDEGLYSLSARNIAGTVSSSVMVHVEESEQEYGYLTYSKGRNIKPKSKPFEEHYDIGDELGRGTQGVTYHAVERLTGNAVISLIFSSLCLSELYLILQILQILSSRWNLNLLFISIAAGIVQPI